MRFHVSSTENPRAFPRKLKIAAATFSTIAGSASTAFSESLLGASTSLLNYFSSPFICVDDPEAVEFSLPQRTPAIAITIVEMAI